MSKPALTVTQYAAQQRRRLTIKYIASGYLPDYARSPAEHDVWWLVNFPDLRAAVRHECENFVDSTSRNARVREAYEQWNGYKAELAAVEKLLS